MKIVKHPRVSWILRNFEQSIGEVLGQRILWRLRWPGPASFFVVTQSLRGPTASVVEFRSHGWHYATVLQGTLGKYGRRDWSPTPARCSSLPRSATGMAPGSTSGLPFCHSQVRLDPASSWPARLEQANQKRADTANHPFSFDTGPGLAWHVQRCHSQSNLS